MPKYTVMFSSERNGELSFTAEDDLDAEDIYENLMTGLIYIDDLDEVNERVNESDLQFYDLRSPTGKLLAD
jgi:hypothetical protein